MSTDIRPKMVIEMWKYWQMNNIFIIIIIIIIIIIDTETHWPPPPADSR